MVVAKWGKLTSIDLREAEEKEAKERSVFQQYWSSVLSSQQYLTFGRIGKRQWKGKSWYTTYYEPLIYDWLSRPTSRSVSRGYLLAPSFFFPFFVSFRWPWTVFRGFNFFGNFEEKVEGIIGWTFWKLRIICLLPGGEINFLHYCQGILLFLKWKILLSIL